MAKKRRLIPFSWRNVISGLSGQSYKRAEAEYYYDGEELERKLAEINFSNDETKLALHLLEVDHKYDRVTDTEFEKQKATLNKEPWVSANLVPDPSSPLSGYFELDWNKYFIQELEKRGYTGVTDEEILDKWLRVLHANQLHEIGVVDPSEEKEVETVRKELDNGRAAYS